MSFRAEVIVPNFNGRAHLSACLESLLAQSFERFRVTVVDNASGDGSAQLVREGFPAVNLIENSYNAGYAGGCNAALRQVFAEGARYFVFVNSDTVADPHWLEELVAAADSDERIGICQSMIRLAAEPQLINSAGNEAHFLGFGYCGHYREEDRGQFGDVTDVPFASGSSMLVRRETLKEVGPMDESLFMYQEDLDLSWRARLAGWRVVLAARSVIYHDYSFSRNQRKFYYLERNRLLLVLRNYGGRTLVVLAPALVGAEVAMLAYALSGKWLRQKLKGYVYVVAHAGEILRTRRRIQQLRHADDSQVVGYWTDRMSFSDLEDSPLTRAANPVSALYWRIAKKLIRG